MATIHEEIATKLSELGPDVREGVKTAMVKKTLDKRVDAIVKVMELRERSQLEIRKIKHDQIIKNDVGDVLMEGYSPDALKKLNEAKDRHAKLEKALERAFDPKKPDYSDVFNLANAP